MQSALNITLTDLTRQERLSIWLRREGVSVSSIAQRLNVQVMTVSRWLKAERLSSWRHRQLVELGIPAELLPPAVDVAPGPQKRPAMARERSA